MEAKNVGDDPVLDLLRTCCTDVAGLKADLSELKERAWLLQGGPAFLSRRVDRLAGDMELARRQLDPTDVD